MGHRNAPRTLPTLVGRVGTAYARRALPPTWIIVSAAIGAWGCWQLIGNPLAGAAAATALFGAALRLGPRGTPWSTPPGWRSVTILLAFALDGASLPIDHQLGTAVLAALGGTALLCLLGTLLTIARTAYLVGRHARALVHADLLELLPPRARQDARQWTAGDDSKLAELKLVVHLAAMWSGMQCLQEPARVGRKYRLVA